MLDTCTVVKACSFKTNTAFLAIPAFILVVEVVSASAMSCLVIFAAVVMRMFVSASANNMRSADTLVSLVMDKFAALVALAASACALSVSVRISMSFI